MSATSTQPRLWVRLLLMTFGVGLATLLSLALIRLLPRPAGGEVIFTAGMGDLFFHRPEAIRPPADPNEILSRHRLVWDADGFRVPAVPATVYPILALGDSFTEGTNVALPWSDVLAAALGTPVYNMGFRGYGPAEEARVLRDYGLKHKPQMVIVGYFEGNDLYDAPSARWRGEFVPPTAARENLQQLGGSFVLPTPRPDNLYQFPVWVELQGTRYEMAFLDGYLGWINGERKVYDDSDNMREVERYFREMQASLNESRACLILAYFPSAPHIYAPYVIPEDRARMLSTVEEMTLPSSGVLIEGKVMPATFEAVMGRLDNQRDAIQALAERLGIPFVDLVPPFREGAARGEVLYYAYDTHWNQMGQTLAGETVAAFLKANPTPCQ